MINKWKQLPPRFQRYTIIASALGALSIGIMMLPESDSSKNRMRGQKEEIRHVLTDRDTRTVGLESLAASVKAMQERADKQDRMVKKFERDLELSRQRANEPPALVKGQLEDMRKKMEKMQNELEASKAQYQAEIERKHEEQERERDQETGHGDEGDALPDVDGQGQRTSFGERYAGSGGSFLDHDGLYLDDLTERNPLDVFQGRRLATTTTDPGSRERPADRSRSTGPKINVVMEQKPEPERAGTPRREDAFFMPAGSILTGVLLNGMDAPTGQGARKDPFPVTMRVQKEAILPNRFRADVRECFIVVAGYGDLSSERAYLRGEVISCVREDGGVIEAKINSYAVGEDGKAGVRGRLISKQGQVIARSLMAGFMSGLSKAFDVKPIAVMDTRAAGSSTDFQRNTPSREWLQSSAVSGASSALDRVAEFYMKMAEGMFPVIEVDAGRQIDLIISSGTRLEFQSMGVNK